MRPNTPEPDRTRAVRFAVISAIASASLLSITSPLHAQVCTGTPNASNLSYQYEQRSVGSSNGASLNLVGSHFAFGLDARMRSTSFSISGQDGALRFTGIINAERVRICPLLRIGVEHDVWDATSSLSITSLTAGLTAGVGVGFEQPVYHALSVAPFFVAGYGFNAVAHSASGFRGTNEITGDTLSGVVMDFGAIARFRRFYGGFHTVRAAGQNGRSPTAVRYVIGFAFSDDKRK